MELYTVCVDGLPVLVMNTNAGALPKLPDSLATNPEFVEAHRAAQAASELIDAQIEEEGGSLDELHHTRAIHEIDETLDAWLGSELQGQGLWNGEPDQVSARRATPDEAARWRRSHEAAINAGEADAGDEDWLIYFVPGTAEVVRPHRSYWRRGP
jgi:hypothetical protein